MPPEAWITLGTNVPVLLLAIFGVVHFSRELGGIRVELRELVIRVIDSLDGALERSDPRIGRVSDPPADDDEDTHDGHTQIVDQPKPIAKRRK